MEHIKNIVYPGTAGATTCGYCSPPGQRSAETTSYHAATLQALKLSCSSYQAMIDRGWRRSGDYCYKPDLRISCCPQYTIKLDAKEFKPSRSHRQLLNRWNRYILYGDPDGSVNVEVPSSPDDQKSTQKKPTSKLPPFTTLVDSIHLAESNMHDDLDAAHCFEIVLEPASYTPHKFALFKKYQKEIHHDCGNTASSFERFLVESPLQPEPIPYSSTPGHHLPRHYGSYHQLYKLDGKLIAMAVLDVLPKCVSSVYFMYDKTWERFSLGKLSALREASLAREIREAGVFSMEALYMGFYIYSCQKMRYKGEYSPSYLVDPETYAWYPLQSCLPLLEKNRYACFSEPSHSSNNRAGRDAASEVDAFELSPTSEEFDGIRLVARDFSGNIITVPIKRTGRLSSARVRSELGSCIRGLGHDLSTEMSSMLRRQVRERREYVYAKSLEAQERQTYERKQQLKESLGAGKALPTELKKIAKDLGKDFAYDEAQAEPKSHIDNEYARAGIQDPKIVITTSRDPSSKLLQFSKEMRLVFPNSHRINRGNYVIKELAEACRANDVTDLILLHEHRGVPDAFIVSHFPHGPTVYFTLSNVALRHDIAGYNKSTVSEQYPHLIFENFTSKLGNRVMDVLKYLFPVPKEDSKRVMTFANEDDFISFRHHVFVKAGREVQLAEVGPRFEMKPYEIRQGTIEQTAAEREWVLTHYTRTARKRTALSHARFSQSLPANKVKI